MFILSLCYKYLVVSDPWFKLVHHSEVRTLSGFSDTLCECPVPEVHCDELFENLRADRHGLVTGVRLIARIRFILLIAYRILRSLTATFGQATRATQRRAVLSAIEGHVMELDCGRERRLALLRAFHDNSEIPEGPILGDL